MDDNERLLKYMRDLEKLKASGVKSEDYKSPLDQETMKVKKLSDTKEKISSFAPTGKISGVTEKIDTRNMAPVLSGEEFSEKIAKLRAAKNLQREAKHLGKTLAKKAAGIIPLAGVGMAALQGDPAMAAEELGEDLAGPLALMKPDVAGESAEDEAQMIAERDAMANYKNSPAASDRLKKLQELVGGDNVSKRGIGSPEWTKEVSDPERIDKLRRLKELMKK